MQYSKKRANLNDFEVMNSNAICFQACVINSIIKDIYLLN